MPIISICNQKGGVAKTTSAYNLAALSAMAGHKTLMVDLDSQASLTISTGAEPLQYENNIATIFDDIITHAKSNIDIIESAIHAVDSIENLFLIPSIIDLAAKETLLNTVTAKEQTLTRILRTIKDQYDYIFIDCSPSLGNLTINALSASDYVLIPTEADYLSYRGLTDLTNVVGTIKELINDQLNIIGVIVTKFEAQTKDANEVLTELQKQYDILGIIKKSVVIKDGIYDGKPLVLNPKNKLANTIKDEYSKVFNQIENTVKTQQNI